MQWHMQEYGVGRLDVFVGQKLVRINLSEQTDMMDLLGADLPVQGGAPGQFAWSVLLPLSS